MPVFLIASRRLKAAEFVDRSDVLNIRTAAVGGTGLPGSGARPAPSCFSSRATHSQIKVQGPRNNRTARPGSADSSARTCLGIEDLARIDWALKAWLKSTIAFVL